MTKKWDDLRQEAANRPGAYERLVKLRDELKEDIIKDRKAIVASFGEGWTDMAFLPAEKYRIIQTEDGWRVLGFDEQQAGWDRDNL